VRWYLFDMLFASPLFELTTTTLLCLHSAIPDNCKQLMITQQKGVSMEKMHDSKKRMLRRVVEAVLEPEQGSQQYPGLLFRNH
jgi:hypothetical protein